jgi:hypothetical protein
LCFDISIKRRRNDEFPGKALVRAATERITVKPPVRSILEEQGWVMEAVASLYRE